MRQPIAVKTLSFFLTIGYKILVVIATIVYLTQERKKESNYINHVGVLQFDYKKNKLLIKKDCIVQS